MFECVMGKTGKYAYCISVVLMLFGAGTVYVVLMGVFGEQMLQTFGVPVEKFSRTDHFREYHVILSIGAGSLLLLKDLKALSYTSVIKCFVMVILVIMAFIFGFDEFKSRADRPRRSFDLPKYPVTPYVHSHYLYSI